MRRLLLIAALLLPGVARAQDGGDLTIAVDPSTVTIGEVFEATVTFTLPAGHEAIVPGEDADFGGAEVRSVEHDREPLPDGATRHQVRYALALWEVGERALRTPAIASRGPDGEVTELEGAEAAITVRSVLPEGAEEIRDIRPPREMPLRWHHYALAALPVLALLALVVLLVRRLRSRRAGEQPEEATVPLSPGEEALLALDELESDDLVGRGLIKEHYVRLSWILRRYIERRWDLPALEETTGMLAYTMAGSGRVPGGVVEQITALLRRADLAKFAKHRPDAATARSDVDAVREIVEATRRREEVDEAAAAEEAVASPAG